MQLRELLRPDVAEDLGKIASALLYYSGLSHIPHLSHVCPCCHSSFYFIDCTEHFVVSRFAGWPPALAIIVAIIGHVCNFMESLSGTTRLDGWKDRQGSKSLEIQGLSNVLSVHQLWVPLGYSSVARRHSLHLVGFPVSSR